MKKDELKLLINNLYVDNEEKLNLLREYLIQFDKLAFYRKKTKGEDDKLFFIGNSKRLYELESIIKLRK